MKILKADRGSEVLDLNCPLLSQYLERFIREELAWRGYHKALVGVSGGVDSALTLALAVRALGAENVHAVAMPHKQSSATSYEHGKLVCEAFGVPLDVVDITPMVEGYASTDESMNARRRGNLMARSRMMVLFDQSEKHHALTLGTGNKTERLFGYFTWHADDTPPINPLGDLYKTQVWSLSEHVGVPDTVLHKAPTADLEAGQTDEGDLGITYKRADVILEHYLKGYPDSYIESLGYTHAEIARVKTLVNHTHWKRTTPATAVVSSTAINEFYLRPLDFRLK